MVDNFNIFKPSFFLPDFIEMQRKSFSEFLENGITNEFTKINPIENRKKNLELRFYPQHFIFTPPECTITEAILKSKTYSCKLYLPATMVSKNKTTLLPQWILVGNIPLMTRRGHFIINGSPRVVINQIIRCPGVYFSERSSGSGSKKKRIFYADFIARRGAWLRIQNDRRRDVWARLKKVPKMPIYEFISDMIDCETESKREQTNFFYKKFKNLRAYDLGMLGRSRINKKLALKFTSTQLMADDVKTAYSFIKLLENNKIIADDIDHLKNRRVKACGELVQNQVETGLYRLEKVIKSKLNKEEKIFNLKEIISTKPLNSALREFFGSSPLSQYMDQTNPLAEITHKRRISSLGPGGISRDTAGMIVRGIHQTHYGRICPIETPEGKNAGLVNSLTIYAKLNSDGFLETPYYKIIHGQVQLKLGFHFFSAEKEEKQNLKIAPGDLQLSHCKLLPTTSIPTRASEEFQDDFKRVKKAEVDYMAMSPIQMISIATSLIPFLEHDDANRALMGSNMQRQALPLIRPERPIVGTGLEGLLVAESGHIIEAKKSGYVYYVSGKKIILQSPENRSRLYFSRAKFKKIKINLLKNCYSKVEPMLPLNGKNLEKTSLLKETSVDMKMFFLMSNFFEKQKKKLQEISFGFLSSQKKDTNSYSFCFQHSIENYSSFLSNYEKEKKNKNFFLSWPLLTPFYNHSLKTYNFISKSEYYLQNYQRSNQETCLTHRAAVLEGDWVQRGDLLADCSASHFGELALGKNLLIAYLPWEGYNFEDAVILSERLIYDDLFTSIHIEKYEIEIKETSYGMEQITKKNFHLWKEQRNCLTETGIIRIGEWVEQGDVLVSKIAPVPAVPKIRTPYERLAHDILPRREINVITTCDTSLRVPKGVQGRIINFQFLNTSANQDNIEYTDTSASSPSRVRVYLAEKRKIQVGDKVAGRHGNKGIVSTILPRQDMPYLPDGSEIDMILNPLGVPSRMNVGQVFECLLGLAGSYLKQRFKITPFDEIYGVEASRSLVYLKLYQARLKNKQEWLFSPDFPGKTRLFDGRSGKSFDQRVTVGKAYMLKLVHLVDEKIHARSTGPYSLVTKQPLGGRAKHGGQRLGEMEVWALEGFGAAYTLQEMLTIKSDDVLGRKKVLKAILRNKNISLGNPDTFKILLRELQSLCLNIGVYTITMDLVTQKREKKKVNEEEKNTNLLQKVEKNKKNAIFSRKLITIGVNEEEKNYGRLRCL